ncbi:MAG: hypothetical protein KME12_27000, partial [Trichocoleus desertorum ATA4-8-CV12]|nr:hypothetical protein [Trichocoleus desertorum ATA4-8-CV12]
MFDIDRLFCVSLSVSRTAIAQIDTSPKKFSFGTIELCLLCKSVERELLKSTLHQKVFCLFSSAMAPTTKSDVTQAIASVYRA